ncbi:zinc finger protein [Anopheles sinensis]|uniref:Zinc finger protein n=1 Tax=Anopheles sinensis TaxID=74873 RepID=A0A084VK67_ANOSI|nr:zinc finger protein [Anopheles sinensis]
MKKGTDATTKAAVAAAAAAAAAANLVENVPDLWAQQDWIKTILSKSGTEIKEVPTEGNDAGDWVSGGVVIINGSDDAISFGNS